MPLVPRSTVKITNLSAKDFCEALAANPNAVIIDVRSEREFNGTSGASNTYGHFKKAINININQLENRIAELNPYKDKEVFVYCSQNYRSPRAAYYLNMQGFNNVKNLTGGLSKVGAAVRSDCYKEHFAAHTK
jgi:rhodanese-related sulfurtransferase